MNAINLASSVSGKRYSGGSDRAIALSPTYFFSGEIKIMYEIVETALAINHHSMFLSNNSEVSKKRSHS